MRCERGCATDPGPRLGLQLDFFIGFYLPEIDQLQMRWACGVLSWASLQEWKEDLIALYADFIFWSNTSTSR